MTHSTKTHSLPVDGHPVLVTEYTPQNDNDRVVLINSATGIRQQFYTAFAKFLNQKGYTVFTYDYRSVGQSRCRPLHEYELSFTDWGQTDYPAVAQLVFRLHPEKAIYLVGHSIGGNCIGLSEITNQFAGIITIGSHHGYLGHYPLLWQPLVWLTFGFWLPLISKWYGYTPNKAKRMGDNLPRRIAEEWAATCKNRNSLLSLLSPDEHFYHRIDRPMLMVSIEDDRIAPRKGVDALQRVMCNAKITRRHLDPKALGKKRIGHINVFRPAFESHWTFITDWIDQVHYRYQFSSRIPLAYHYHQQLYDYLNL